LWNFCRNSTENPVEFGTLNRKILWKFYKNYRQFFYRNIENIKMFTIEKSTNGYSKCVLKNYVACSKEKQTRQ